MEVSALVVASLFFLAGIAGTILPMLPGTPLILVGMFVYGYLTGFATLDAYFFVGQGVATALTFAVDYVATALGTRRYGGGKRAAFGAALGMLLGALVFGPIGLIIGAFVGAAATELLSGKQIDQARRAGIGALVGFVGAVVVKLIIVVVMIAWFFLRVM